MGSERDHTVGFPWSPKKEWDFTPKGLWFGDHGQASENKVAGVVSSCLRRRLLLHLETPFSAFLKHRGDS